ncbi:protein Mpv17, partial [Tremellales sp. Uapishka_1]
MPPAALLAFVRFYNSNFDRRPIPTLIVTNGVLNTIADVLAQTSQIILSKPSVPSPDSLEFQPPAPSFDPERTLRFAVFGMAMGPIIGRWMRILERSIPMKVGQNGGGLQLAKRVLADQLIMAPVGLCLFVGSMGLMEGRDSTEIQAKFADMYMPAIIANWKVWPVVQTVNFKLVPLQYRVPFQSTCGIAWTLYLSLLNARDDKQLDA